MTAAPPATAPQPAINPWVTLGTICLGFFMILVDTTIVTVATPGLMRDLGADQNTVLWVTSAYLLAYSAPLLITGRLGDRFGPKWLYLTGLVVFTLASLWCGLTGSIEGLIAARVVQGLGAAMITPQTMAIITRVFPPERRGSAMAVWGATAGVATLVGPILGGVLVDSLGWEWIFFVNIPVGLLGAVLALRFVPALGTHPHRFDWLGVALSGVGLFALVFGIQSGEQHGWGALIWSLILGGLVVLAGFLLWQHHNRAEPLLPLGLFTDRNFSVANAGIACMGFAAVSMGFPLMIYAQLVRGYSATGAAMLMAPMAVTALVMAPVIGRLSDRVHPRLLAGAGFGLVAVSLSWLAWAMAPGSSLPELLAPMAVYGLGQSGIWAVLSATATRNLPMTQAGAGAGVYNTTRTIGSVIGSAAIAVLMDARLQAHGLGHSATPETAGAADRLPEAVRGDFSDAMAQTMLLPAAITAIGFVVVIFFVLPRHLAERRLPSTQARRG